MEYCPETLESRIQSSGLKQLDSGYTSTTSENNQAEVNQLSAHTTQTPITDSSSNNAHITDSSTNNTPLNDLNESSSGFDWVSVVDIINDINRGLVYLHQNNIVHRDLKPKNGTWSTEVL